MKVEQIKEYISYDVFLQDHTGMLTNLDSFGRSYLGISADALPLLFRLMAVHLNLVLIQTVRDQCEKLIYLCENSVNGGGNNEA